MATVYERRLDAALSKVADDAYMHSAAVGFGLRRQTVSHKGLDLLKQWAIERGRQMTARAAEHQVPVAVLDDDLHVLRILMGAAIDVAAGAPVRRLERRIVPPVIPSDETGGVRQAISRVPLDADPDTNLARLVVALRGAAQPSGDIPAPEEMKAG